MKKAITDHYSSIYLKKNDDLGNPPAQRIAEVANMDSVDNALGEGFRIVQTWGEAKKRKVMDMLLKIESENTSTPETLTGDATNTGP